MACARLANANSSANVNTKNKPSWRVYFLGIICMVETMRFKLTTSAMRMQRSIN